MSESKEITVRNKVGLHARPAAAFVKKAASFKSTIKVENLTTSSNPINAKSFVSLLSIEVKKNDCIRITCEGVDENEALEGLCELVRTNFGEPIED